MGGSEGLGILCLDEGKTWTGLKVLDSRQEGAKVQKC